MFNKLVLSGGSSRGYYQLGCLYKHRDDITNIKSYIGTSVGSLINLLLVCNYDILDIFKFSINIKCDIPSISNIFTIAPKFLSTYGLLDDNNYIIELERLVYERYKYIPTMIELYKLTGKDVTFVTSCITTHSTIYINHITHPDLSCIQAVNMSSRIPFLFTPVLYKGDLYVDGSLCNHFPLININDDDNVLAIHIDDISYGKVERIQDMSIFRYLISLLNTGLKSKYDHIKNKDNVTLYEIPFEGTGINATSEYAMVMFLIGYYISPIKK